MSTAECQPRQQKELREMLPELGALPENWIIRVDDDKRVYYEGPDKQTNYDHPTLGALPSPWIIRCCTEADGKRYPRYFHRDTKKFTTKDPRTDKVILRKQNNSNSGGLLGTAMQVHKMKRGLDLQDFSRQKISGVNLRDHFDIVKVLDDGGGLIGGMNGGVFVVKTKKPPYRLMVEKRFKQPKPTDDPWTRESTLRLTRAEIEMLYRLKHSSITFYQLGFITPLCASVYVEFCDRGSMENLIKAYAKQRNAAQNLGAEQPEMPERFIWHAFATLCDGLAFLMGGRSYLSNDITNHDPAPGWVPTLHRDMKPDNVLLRSRATVGTKRYFYCVISDFGLACEDWPEGHKNEDPYQERRSKIGTRHYFAPELLYNPYPRSCIKEEKVSFPAGQKHTAKSDLWSLAATIYNLADCGPTMLRDGLTTAAFAHITDAQPQGLDEGLFFEGTISRKCPLDIGALKVKKKYSNELRDAILLGTRWDPEKRPNPIEMVKALKILMERSGFTTHVPHGAHDEELPNWATRAHDYHSLPPIDPNNFGN